MARFVYYFGQANKIWRDWGGLPAPARLLVGLAALPFLVVAGLSVGLLVVSLLALLAVVGPIYWALYRLSNMRWRRRRSHRPRKESPGRKQVESTIVS
jgi:Flp pilus assembly protein TadB